MYEITTESHFCAAHRLLEYDGPCENLHGHNWHVKATVKCGTLDKSGLGIDFKVLKRKLNDILTEFDHRNLNDVISESPSSERIARLIYQKLSSAIDVDGVKVARVEVQETPGNCAAYYE
ncbi:MAG: 6-carboxytetrahydropterin synthase QueD [Chitinispirillia bacterium]|nr:6-carboxytetrahydropterin synthase QueD [Chitinispirillia bacterium]MCL2269038.1 6-carboxytetrahydropterin synthase QueD [Chitinispirillia bacterium]